MDRKYTRMWFIIIFIVLIALWILELNGTIAKQLENEREIYKLNLVKREGKGNTKAKTLNGNETDEGMLESLDVFTVERDYFENQDITSKVGIINKDFRPKKRFHKRSSLAEPKIPHRDIITADQNEMSLEQRAATNSATSTTTDPNKSTTIDPNNIVLPPPIDTGKKKCNPKLDVGEMAPPDFDPNLPACRPKPPDPTESTPGILYTGRKNYGDIGCWSNERIAQEQKRGLDFTPTGDMASDSTNANADLKRKAEAIESNACNRKNGLECIEKGEVDEAGTRILSCRCANAFGGKPSERLMISGSCYRRVGKGDQSSCEGDDALPLPSGDTGDYRQRNPVMLKCAPGSDCSSDGGTKRCFCKKGLEADRTGTCASFAISTKLFWMMHWNWKHYFVALIFLFF